MQGEFKFLYETDKEAFKIRFGEYIHKLVETDPDLYVRRLLQDAVRTRGLLPCLIFDNADHFPQDYQEHVFQYAQSVFRSSLSFIVCPITDRTIWQLSKSGPFQSYPTTTFYLPVPSTRAVLGKRIEFLKQKLEGEPSVSGEYFSSRGIRLKISDLGAFALVLEDVLLNTEYLGRLIGWLSNHDIRRGLKIAQRIVTSPILGIDQLVVLYVTGKRGGVDEWKIRRALVQGDYSGFRQTDSDFILNLFSVPIAHVTTPFAKVSVLRVLFDRENEGASAEDRGSATEHAYLSAREIMDYLEVAGISANATLEICSELLRYRLIEPYDPTDQDVYPDQRVRITHSGKIHLEMALDDEVYATQMALHTPLHNGDVIARAREMYYGSGKLDREGWLALLSIFYSYCRNEDKTYVDVPWTSSYEGQRDLRTRLVRRWMRPEDDKPLLPPPKGRSVQRPR